jgi:hypothetical protein
LSATKSITADIINIKTLTIGSPQYITAATGVINSSVSVTRLSPGLNLTQAVTIANGTADGFVKVIEIIDSVATSISISGANLHSTISFTTDVGVGGQGAILVWDNDSEFWIVTALNNGAGGSSGGQVNSITAGSYIGVDSTDPVNPTVNLDLPDCDTTGKVLSSTTAGVLSWVAQGSGMATNDGTGTGNTTLQSLVITNVVASPTGLTINSNFGLNKPAFKVVNYNNDRVFMAIGGVANNLTTTSFNDDQIRMQYDNALWSTYGFGSLKTGTDYYYSIAGQTAPVVVKSNSSQSGTPFPVVNASTSATWNVVQWTTTETVGGNALNTSTSGGNLYINFENKNIKITWSSTVYNSQMSQTRLRLNNTTVATGNNVIEGASNATSVSTGSWVGTPANDDIFKLEHYTQQGDADGMGGSGYAGEDKTNAFIVIEDIGGRALNP